MKNIERKIILGLELAEAPKEITDPLGTSRMGSAAFLDFLEPHCGIVPAQQSQIERLAAFMGVLADNKERFPSYRASWVNAPLAVAKRMLDWVDAWYLHGWEGMDPLTDSATPCGDVLRIVELMSIEQESRASVAPGVGQRLLAVARSLEEGVRVPVSIIEIVDGREDWPTAWLRVFNHLPCNWKTWPPRASSPDVSVMKFDSSIAAARALGNHSFFGTSCGKTVFLYEDDSSLRDEVLLDTGRPQTGTRGKETGNPVSQIFPLALSLYRDPPDMKDWLGFLSLPVCPLGAMRYDLARTIAKTGGIKGEKWQKAIDHARDAWIEKGRTGESFDEFVSDWLPQTRYSDTSFPRAVILEIAGRVAGHLCSRDDDLEVDTALQRIAAFTRAIELLGASYNTVNWSIVEEILAIVQASGRENADNRREAGSEPVWRKPGAIIEPCDTLVWYLPRIPDQTKAWPWSAAEMKFLSRCGCSFPELSVMSARQFKVAQRVIALVKGKIILVSMSGNERQSLAELVLSGSNGDKSFAVLSGEKRILSGEFPETTSVKARPLPRLGRWWDVKTNLSPAGDWACSFTALDDFLERPAKWLLKYRAGIRNGSVLSLPDVPQFTGTCAHKMIETFFADFGDKALTLGKEEYNRWYDEAFPVVIEQLAFPLLSADMAHARITFSKRLNSSILALRDFLRRVDARNIRFEERVGGNCFEASFKGFADLVFENGEGLTGIIDMKYSHWMNIFRKKLETDTDIQLTIYAELWRQGHGEIPETAYWLFPKEKLLARNDSFYPGAITLSTGSSHEDRIDMIADTVAWRNAQLAEGRIEVVCDATQKLVDAGKETSEEPPAGALALGDSNDGFDDYLGLYGWSDLA